MGFDFQQFMHVFMLRLVVGTIGWAVMVMVIIMRQHNGNPAR